MANPLGYTDRLNEAMQNLKKSQADFAAQQEAVMQKLSHAEINSDKAATQLFQAFVESSNRRDEAVNAFAQQTQAECLAVCEGFMKELSRRNISSNQAQGVLNDQTAKVEKTKTKEEILKKAESFLDIHAKMDLLIEHGLAERALEALNNFTGLVYNRNGYLQKIHQILDNKKAKAQEEQVRDIQPEKVLGNPFQSNSSPSTGLTWGANPFQQNSSTSSELRWQS